MVMAVWRKKSMRIILLGIIILILLGVLTGLTVLILDYFNLVDMKVVKTNFQQRFIPRVAGEDDPREDPLNNELQTLKREIDKLQKENISLRNEIRQKSNDLVDMIQELDQLQTKLVQLENSKISQSRVAEVYERMRPQQAAAILGKLPEEEVLAILIMIDTQQVSQILAQLEPNQAASLTQGMNNPKGGD